MLFGCVGSIYVRLARGVRLLFYLWLSWCLGCLNRCAALDISSAKFSTLATGELLLLAASPRRGKLLQKRLWGMCTVALTTFLEGFLLEQFKFKIKKVFEKTLC